LPFEELEKLLIEHTFDFEKVMSKISSEYIGSCEDLQTMWLEYEIGQQTSGLDELD